MPPPLTDDELAEYGVPVSTNGKPRINGHADMPPHDLNAEQSVIGSVLLDPTLLDSLAERLKAGDFHGAHTSRVYGEMTAMRRAGIPIDSTLLIRRLADAGALDKIVTTGDIAEMADSVPTPANATHYADIVAHMAERRRAWMLADRLKAMAHRGPSHGDDYDAWRGEIEAMPGDIFRGDGDSPGGIDHGWMTCADFMGQDVRQTWLCDGVVPEAQGGIISGRFKTLKTSIACDLFWSMATGTRFLEHFNVPAPVPCALMTSESGPASIMGIMRRIAASKGGDYRDGPHLTTHRAKMTDPRHLEILERDIEKHGWKCVGIDPTYLAFAEVGEFCTNVYKMGAALEPVTALIQRTGCSLILLNHSTKIRGKDVKRYDPPDLGEISMSGWAEWMRFWLLLSQAEEWHEPSGTHFLWLKVGGSVGHGSLQTLEVSEGEHDTKGRRTKWAPCLMDVAAAGETKKREAENAKAKQRERTEQEHERKLVDALKQCPAGETEKQLSVLSGLNKTNLATALRSLLKAGRAEQCTVAKRGQEYDGYRQKGLPGQTGQDGTNGGTVPPS